MPRFFFDYHDGAYMPDKVGTDLQDLVQARKELRRIMGDIAAHGKVERWPAAIGMTVRGADGAALLEGRLSLMIEELSPQSRPETRERSSSPT